MHKVCVTSPWVVHGPIYGHFMGCTVNSFLSVYKGLPRLGTPAKRPDESTKRKQP